MIDVERCPKCGQPCTKCRCNISPCHLPLEEETDGETVEVEYPEYEKKDGYKRKEPVKEE